MLRLNRTGRHAIVTTFASGAVLMSILSTSVSANGRPFSAVYEASIAGVTVGEATLTGTVDPRGGYDVEMRAKYRVLLWKGTMKSRASGRIEGDRIATSNYTITTEAKEQRTASVGIDQGVVARIAIEPPPKLEGRVPLTEEHKRGVVDPLSGMIIGALRAANSANGPCAGTLPVYTGWNRFDLKFAPPELTATAGAAAAPTTGPREQICELRFAPIAGHKPGDKNLAKAAASRDMRISFKGTDASGLKLPSEITVPIWVGALHIKRRQ